MGALLQRRFTSIATLAFLTSAALLAPARGNAGAARIEVYPFQSVTLTDEEFLTGKQGKPVMIAGELRLPKAGTDRLPAVVLVHASGGIGGNIDDWAQFFNSMGVAAFILDGFTARGITNTINDQSQLGRLTMIVDAFRALELLARHPRVEPKRIALMGVSRGAKVTLYASLRRFQRLYGPKDASFALFIPFYPDCSTTYVQDEDVVDRPIRVFHGTDDDWSPVSSCRDYLERLRKSGKDVRLTEYAGAGHFFDATAFKSPMKLPQAQTLRHCRLAELAEGRIVNAETRQPFSYNDPCVERGTTLAYDAHAHGEAEKSVAELVKMVLMAR